VLLDTGAEISFIDDELANDLSLPTVATKKLRLHTFGSEDAKEKTCRLVQLPIWDEDGGSHVLQLLTHEILTKPLLLPPLTEEDLSFIGAEKAPSQKKQISVSPRILIGCDQIWQFLRQDRPPLTLPSGLYLLPTKIGNIITGRIHSLSSVLQLQASVEQRERDRWDDYWSLHSHINTIQAEQEEKNDEDIWDSYWTLESAGTQEFGRPERDEKARLDKQIWNEFNRTVERRKDGYYARLPWKAVHPPLPDNKAIALKRLSSWNSLQGDKALLEQYKGVFEEQIRLNILEEIPQEEWVPGRVIHYIPHQPVLTPHKTTTKLRIVFDASTHYKGC
ncbi:hypothetical protein OESDEN_19574, partial [Oesophagostomum dentatum]